MIAEPRRDLWPDTLISISPQVVPTTILKEQASLLGQKTQNIILARVDSGVDPMHNNFIDDFYLVAPALDNYGFGLFTVVRGIEHPYPVQIFSDTLDLDGYEIASEDEFLKELERIFSHPKTTNIIKSMLIQSGWSPESQMDPSSF